MRKLKFTLLAPVVAAALTLAFASCDPSDIETSEPKYELRVIDFEAAELDENGILNDESYEEKGLAFNNNNFPADNFWYGFAVSNKTDKSTAGWTNQFSVYGTGGYGGSKKFGVGYEATFNEADGSSSCFNSFGEDVEYEIDHAWINNSTYAYLSVRDGDGYGKTFGAEDWFKLTVTGFDATGNKTDAVEIYLADFRNGKSFIMSEWTKVDLTPLGAINKLDFSLTSTDNDPVSGIKTPTYFCIDNVAYRVYE